MDISELTVVDSTNNQVDACLKTYSTRQSRNHAAAASTVSTPRGRTQPCTLTLTYLLVPKKDNSRSEAFVSTLLGLGRRRRR